MDGTLVMPFGWYAVVAVYACVVGWRAVAYLAR